MASIAGACKRYMTAVVSGVFRREEYGTIPSALGRDAGSAGG